MAFPPSQEFPRSSATFHFREAKQWPQATVGQWEGCKLAEENFQGHSWPSKLWGSSYLHGGTNRNNVPESTIQSTIHNMYLFQRLLKERHLCISVPHLGSPNGGFPIGHRRNQRYKLQCSYYSNCSFCTRTQQHDCLLSLKDVGPWLTR